MKKLILFLMVSVSLGSVSCSSDDGGTKNFKPEGYPEQIDQVDFTGKKVGDEVLLTGKGFDEAKAGEYEIIFIKRLPEKKSTTLIAPRAPKPEESNETVNAYILKVTETSILFSIPSEAGNGSANFVYKKYASRIGNFQR